MPELPDLEVVRDVLNERIASQQIVEFEVLRPLVLRSLVAEAPADFCTGQTIERILRRGKFLLFQTVDPVTQLRSPFKLQFGGGGEHFGAQLLNLGGQLLM